MKGKQLKEETEVREGQEVIVCLHRQCVKGRGRSGRDFLGVGVRLGEGDVA